MDLMQSLQPLAHSRYLESLRILLVEHDDEFGREMSGSLRDSGAQVRGPLDRNAALRVIARERPDGALVDIEAMGQTLFNVAYALLDAGVPFALLATPSCPIPDDFKNVTVLRKPVRPTSMVGALITLMYPSVDNSEP